MSLEVRQFGSCELTPSGERFQDGEDIQEMRATSNGEGSPASISD